MKKTNHLVHAILTVVTLGVWGVVWIIVGVKNSSHNKSLLESKESNDSALPEMSDSEAIPDISSLKETFENSDNQNSATEQDEDYSLPVVRVGEINETPTPPIFNYSRHQRGENVAVKGSKGLPIAPVKTDRTVEVESDEVALPDFSIEPVKPETYDFIMDDEDDEVNVGNVGNYEALFNLPDGNEAESPIDHSADTDIENPYMNETWDDDETPLPIVEVSTEDEFDKIAVKSISEYDRTFEKNHDPNQRRNCIPTSPAKIDNSIDP